jgi:hypothetical protein
MKKFSCLLVCVFFGWAQGAGATTLCEDLQDLADAWDELTGAAVEVFEGEVTEQEARELDQAIGESLASTRTLANALGEQLTGRAGELVKELQGNLNALDQAADSEQTLDAMEAIIESLDLLAEDCSGEQEAGPVVAGPVVAGPEAALPGGQVTVSFQPPSDPELEPMAAGLQASGVFDGLADLVSSVLVLPDDLPVVFASCGEPNAFFDSENGRVVMCYEFFALFTHIFSDPETSAEEVQGAVLGTGAFFLLHEIGHALVHLLELPITGREEDAVDNLASVILIRGEVHDALLAAIVNFGALAVEMESGETPLPVWNEHSLSSQRLYDVACLLYGSNPEVFADLVGDDGLPPERAARCPAEYEQKERAWDALLAPHYAGE